MNILEEYKKSLKLKEVEEIFDLFFYRPLAFLFVKSVYRTRITPNQVTWLALLIGFIGALFFMAGTRQTFIAGALLLIIYIILDCSDGQLARLQNSGTLTGRIIDGFADYVVTISAYIGIGIGYANNTHEPTYYWILTVLAGISHAIHSLIVDYYRNQFLDYALNRKSILGEDLKIFEEEYNRLISENKKSFDRLLIWIYLKYSRLQVRFSSDNQSARPKRYDHKDYYHKNKRIMRMWSYIGPTADLTFMIVCAVFNRWDIFLWGMIIVFNSYALILYIFQTRVNHTLIIEEES
jgi:phosphatidylglycerophosphate synthase